MSNPSDAKGPDRAAEANEGRAPKKPYRKPEFRHERVFETSALNCGKVNTHQAQCAASRKAS